MKLKELTRLLAVLIIGFMFGSGVTPLHAEDPVPAGEILRVCINKKSGALRVATKCTRAERKTVLGGVGAQGERGLTGATGSQGPQGVTGATGVTGSVASLRTRSITVWQQSFGSFCSSFGGFSALNGNTSLSTFGSTISLNKSCSTLSPQTSPFTHRKDSSRDFLHSEVSIVL
jgi:hypothetical protein